MWSLEDRAKARIDRGAKFKAETRLLIFIPNNCVGIFGAGAETKTSRGVIAARGDTDRFVLRRPSKAPRRQDVHDDR